MKTIDILKLTRQQKNRGIYIIGDKNNGEYKEWYLFSSSLFKHSFYKNGQLHGEYKKYHPNGDLRRYLLYDNGDIIKDYLKDENN